MVRASYHSPRLVSPSSLPPSLPLSLSDRKPHAQSHHPRPEQDVVALGPLPSATDTRHGGDKVAIIIETTMVPNLIPVMLHFAQVLGPSWNMVLFTDADSWTMPDSAGFLRLLDSGQLRIAFLPLGADLRSHYGVSVFLTRPWLWQQLQTAHRVLVFQVDSMLCTASNQTVDDFLQYDLVGAPIAPDFGAGFNGGLSLRNPALMLAVATATATTDEDDFFGDAPRPGLSPFEDQWFYARLKDRGAHLPDEAVAKTFAVETVWYDRPLGFHQPFRFHPDKADQITAWCPEVGMMMAGRLAG